MTEAQFLTAFSPVFAAFGHNRFPAVVLERIQKKLWDFTVADVVELTDLILDNCEHAPKTSKVVELANIIRARKRGASSEKDPDVGLYCEFCSDLGVIRAVATDGTHETLMRCQCSNDADKSNWKLPRITNEWRPLYRAERCPISWFKPEILFRNPDGTIQLENINRKRDYWLAKVRIAEEFWVNLRKDMEGA